MKKHILNILILLLTESTYAAYSGQDSLRMFLEYVGENRMIISKIMESQEANEPSKTIETYLMFHMRLEYDFNKQILNWNYGWNDSVFVCKCTEFITQRIINDTALNLIEPCLLEAYLISYNKKYNEQLLLNCAEFAIEHFHAGNAITIPYIYYGNRYEVADRKEKLRYYEMVNFILSGVKHIHYFDKVTNEIFNKIIAQPDKESLYYLQFRNLLNSYSDIELARITEKQERNITNFLLQGIAAGEDKAKMTYAFMLLTGQFVEKNEELGNRILHKLLE